jgi:hypothetical protein
MNGKFEVLICAVLPRRCTPDMFYEYALYHDNWRMLIGVL